MEKKVREFLCNKLIKISAETELYYVFSIIAILLSSVIFACVLIYERNALNALMEIFLVFLIIYSLTAMATIRAKYNYQQGLKLLIVLIPGIMTTIGSSLAFWLCYEDSGGRMVGSILLIVAAAALIIIPFLGTFLSSRFGTKENKIYFLSMAQMIISGLICWLEYSLF